MTNLPASNKTKSWFGYLVHEMNSMKWRVQFWKENPDKFDQEQLDRALQQLSFFAEEANKEWKRLDELEDRTIETEGARIASLYEIDSIDTICGSYKRIKRPTDQQWFEHQFWLEARRIKDKVV